MDKLNIKGLDQKQPKISQFLNRKINKKAPQINDGHKMKSNISPEFPHYKEKTISKQKIERHAIYERRESISLHQHQIKLTKNEEQVAPSKNVNVLFYLNSMPSQPNGEYINTIHKDWYSDYSKLERQHAYIQWIFPNSFQSRFNHHAKPLSFQTNSQIVKRYIKSYEMMLTFYGFKLIDRKKGVLARSKIPFHRERFSKTLLTSFHNHMRITRILTSLKQTGFSTFALEFCKILKFEIYDLKGDMNSLQKYNVYREWQAIQKAVLASPQSKSVYFIEQQSEKQQKEEKIIDMKKQERQIRDKTEDIEDQNLFKTADPPKQVEKVAVVDEKIEKND